MLVRMWSNGNTHSLLVEMQSGTASLEDSLAISYKIKHTLAMNPAIALLGIYPKELKTMFTQNPTHVYSSFIHNCQNLETNKMYFQ